MNSSLFQKILDEHEELSSLPQTLVEVLRVVKDEASSAQDLANVLRRDPPLTVKILRVVNSPFYGAGREITSVRQAVVTLGIRAVTAVALSTSIYDFTDKWHTSIDRMRFWRHSLEVAVTSRMIAEAIGYPAAEEAFVAGLIHDIGMLVLEKSFSEEYTAILRQSQAKEGLLRAEEEKWGTNHARVGQFLLEQWNLPSGICEAVGLHHDEFQKGASSPELRLPQIIALANLLSQFNVIETHLCSVDIQKKELLAENLSLKEAKLRHIEETHLTQTLDEAKFLEINIGSHSELLNEANRMLYLQYGTVESLLRENRQMQQHLALAKLDKAALDTLKTISATFNHYINNAVGTILGRAQLVEVALKRGEIIDHDDCVAKSMGIIINGVKTIKAVVEELTRLSSFKTTVYHDETYIIDIENKLKKKLQDINVETPEMTP